MSVLLWGLILLGAVTIVGLLPVVIDVFANRSGRLKGRDCSQRARDVHGRLWIADLHADSLLWNRNLLHAHRRGHVDVQRLLAGNVALQVFTVVSKIPCGINFESNSDRRDLVTPLLIAQRWPRPTWGSLLERAKYQAAKLRRFAEASNGTLSIIESRTDLAAYLLARRHSPRRVAGLLGIEGAQVLENKLSNLQVLYREGFRLLGLTHFFDTEVAGSAHGRQRGGLTPLGRQVVKEMQRLGMIVDLAHASPTTIDDVLEVAEKPVLVSHTGVQGTCAGPRNLEDRHIRGIAERNGLVGVAYFKHATCGKSVQAIVDAMAYVVDLVGAEHVALGSDFDGAVRTPFDAAGLIELTNALLEAGFSESQVAAIMGGNVQRFLLEVLEPA